MRTLLNTKYLMLLFLLEIFSVGLASSQRLITVDSRKINGLRNNVYRECIGAGRAAEGLRADWQQQLLLVQQTVPFKYIRFHGILCDEMHIYSENPAGKVIYNWQYLDKLYDFLLSIHLKPFVEFGFMPPALASGSKTVFWWKGNVTLPKSYDKWNDLITAFVKHLQDRYGSAEVKTWFFEVWNEPNLKSFFAGNQTEYFELYQNTVNAIKRVSKDYKVGGPATAKNEWIKDFLEYCSVHHLPLDFISTHSYNTSSVFDEFGKNKRKLLSTDYLYNNVQEVRRIIDSTQYKGLPLHYTEFNSSPSPHDPIHDTYQNAAYIINTLRHTENIASSMSYWTFTDIFEESGPPVTPFHGGFGLINLQGIKKPTFFAYKFLYELGDTELINADSQSIITKNSKGYQILVWNLKFPENTTVYDEDYFKEEIHATSDGKVNVNLNNLIPSRYQIKIYQIGYLQNDAFSAYRQMGSPSYISPAQENELKSKADGRPIFSKIFYIKKNYQTTLSIRTNDVFLIKLVRL